MATVKLTPKLLEATRKHNQINVLTTTLWDGELTGFGIRISHKGKGSWLVYARLAEGGSKAKQILHVFGHLDKLPDIDKARSLARSLLVDIEKGIDPNKERKTKRDSDIDAYVNGKLKDIFNAWYEKHRASDYETPGTYWYEVGRRFNKEVLPKLGESTPVSTINKQQILKLIDDKEKITKSGARQVYNAINPFFNWCVSRELIPTSPMLGLSPPENPEARDRVLTEDELRLFWKAATVMPYPWGPYYRLLLLTLQRREEVADLGKAEIAGNEWIIPKHRTKNNKEHLVHLSPLALEILETIPEQDSSFVFTTTLTTGISGFSKAKAKLDEEMTKLLNKDNRGEPLELKPWRLHDLRRTAATYLGKLKVPPHVTERILNHVSGTQSGVQGIYQRFEYAEERKQAIYKWSNYVNSINKHIENNQNVLPFLR